MRLGQGTGQSKLGPDALYLGGRRNIFRHQKLIGSNRPAIVRLIFRSLKECQHQRHECSGCMYVGAIEHPVGKQIASTESLTSVAIETNPITAADDKANKRRQPA